MASRSLYVVSILLALGIQLVQAQQTPLLQRELAAWSMGHRIGLFPVCSESSKSEPEECALKLSELAKKPVGSGYADAIALAYVQFLMNLEGSSQTELRRRISIEATNYIKDRHRTEGSEYFAMLLEAAYFQTGSLWTSLAHSIIRANEFPKSWDAQISLILFLEHSFPKLDKENFLLDLTFKALQASPDHLNRLEQAVKYFDLLSSGGRTEEAESFRTEFSQVSENQLPIPISLPLETEPGHKEWWPLAQLVSTYCYRPYLELMRTDSNCKKALSVVEQNPQIQLDRSWIHKAHESLKEAGFAN